MATRRQKKLVPIQRKIDKRERRREMKALVAAKIDNAIEQQLLDRLKKGTYEGVYNFPETAFEKAIDTEKEDMEYEVEEEDVEVGKETVEYVAAGDFEESDISDIEDAKYSDSSDDDEKDAKIKKKKINIEIEYENETNRTGKSYIKSS